MDIRLAFFRKVSYKEIKREKEYAVKLVQEAYEIIEERRIRHKEDGWIAVDLDGTLAYHRTWGGLDVIGAPIPLMVERVKKWIAEGYIVKIFTARLAQDPDGVADRAIRAWTKEHIGTELEPTCIKHIEFVEFWDDRGIQIIPNTGKTVMDEALAVALADAGAP